MTRRLIVNIRGANASGKTTLVRNMIAAGNALDTFQLGEWDTFQLGEWDGVKVQAHMFGLYPLRLPVLVIGTYDASKYSGCDKIKSAQAIEDAVRHAATQQAHVVFEGFRVSKSYTRFAALRNELVKGDPTLTWLWALLHAPKELIWERAQARREDGKLADKEELAAVVRQIDKTRQTVRQLWPQDVLTLDPAAPAEAMYERLLGEMVARERGETRGPDMTVRI